MQTFWQDLRYGARMLVKNPGFTLVAVLTLALGIGANTAIFSVVNAVLLRALPYKDADQLVIVWESNRRRGGNQNVVNPANFMDWEEQNSVFTDMAAFADSSAVVVGDGEPEEVPAQFATPNLFSVLGIEAMLGRTFSPQDGQPDQPRVVVLSYGLWQRRYNGDPGIIGRRLNFNRDDATVVGVMPPGFRWFIRRGSLSGKSAELWSSYQITNEMRIRRGRYLSVVARIKPGMSTQQAETEMNTIGG